MPSVPPKSPAVAPVAKPRCPPYRHVPAHRPSYRLQRATQIRALVRSALSRWNVAHRASGTVMLKTSPVLAYVPLPATSFQFAFPCMPPYAVELIRHGAAESVDGGLTVSASNLARRAHR